MHAYSFSTSKHKNTFIDQFAWARAEVSASAHLKHPSYQWEDTDLCTRHPFSGVYLGSDFLPSDVPLLPPSGPRDVVGILDYRACSAAIEYLITYDLHKYAPDSPGGTGCFPSALQLPAVR